jgi:hypothetical protein
MLNFYPPFLCRVLAAILKMADILKILKTQNCSSNGDLSVQHYVIKFVSDLRQVGGFLRVLRFPPPLKLTATI